MFKLSNRSQTRLAGVDSGLAAVVRRAIEISQVDFSVIEGLRTIGKQKEYFDTGKSKTMNSRHLTGHAVDLYPWVDGKTSHADHHYELLKKAMFTAAKELNEPIEWGGNWKSIIDKPHWQKPWVTK